MKGKVLIIIGLLLCSNLVFGIGLPHGFVKKKKLEKQEGVKREYKIEKKIILTGTQIVILASKYFQLRD
jgi:hypothetical protein